MRQSIGKLVGRDKSGDWYWLDEVFEDGDFRGAVGSVFRPISEAVKKDSMNPDNAKDWLLELWQGVVESGSTKKGLDDFVQSVIDVDGEDAFFDLSYYDTGCEIAEVYNSELEPDADESEKAEFSDCVGGGRCFGRQIKWAKIYDDTALQLALSYEKD